MSKPLANDCRTSSIWSQTHQHTHVSIHPLLQCTATSNRSRSSKATAQRGIIVARNRQSVLSTCTRKMYVWTPSKTVYQRPAIWRLLLWWPAKALKTHLNLSLYRNRWQHSNKHFLMSVLWFLESANANLQQMDHQITVIDADRKA